MEVYLDASKESWTLLIWDSKVSLTANKSRENGYYWILFDPDVGWVVGEHRDDFDIYPRKKFACGRIDLGLSCRATSWRNHGIRYGIHKKIVMN